MTIQQAIERAKQLQRERQAAGEKPAARAAAPRVRKVRGLSEHDTQELGAPKFSFPEVTPRVDVCAENRILLNGERTPLTAAAIDAYRILRTQLRTRALDNDWTRFGVTSAGPSEGKSTTALNLSLTLARERKHNVYLIDLDLRNPSLAGYLGIRPPTEIGAYLEGQVEAKDVFFSVGVEHLFVAAGTRHFESSSELLSGPRLERLLANIAEEDPDAWVIVDLPPLLATADALTVSPALSAILLVISEGKTSRHELERAVGMIGDGSVGGIVLNQSTTTSQGYYGYY